MLLMMRLNKRKFHFLITKTVIIRLITILLLGITTLTEAYALLLDDKGQINSTSVSQVVNVKSENDIAHAIEIAKAKHLPISIMAVQHSQGGQTLAQHAVVLNMLAYNKILNLDVNNKRITVQSGILWADLQKYINQYNLAIKSMQSPNIFSVGGSLSVNAHGDDFRSGAVGNTIVSLHMMLANGSIISVSPTSHPEMWVAVRGGYGVLGVVTDVTLQLTDNHWLISHYRESSIDDFQHAFVKYISNDNNTVLFYAHVNITPGPTFLNDMYVITYSDTQQAPNTIIALDNPDKWNAILKPTFNVSRHGSYGKSMRWKMEKRIFKKIYDNHRVSRNNAMEKPLRFASDYHRTTNADWLQEYFIPVARFSEFMHALRSIARDNPINLLNVTIRYVKAEHDILLSYANTDCFSVVLYFNQDLNNKSIESTKKWTRKLIDAALSVHGNYYLTYQDFAIQAQFEQAYPHYKKFISIKNHYDPDYLFDNKFYQKRFKTASFRARR